MSIGLIDGVLNVGLAVDRARDDDDTFWSVSRMMSRANMTSQHGVVEPETDAHHMRNTVTVRVPSSSLTGHNFRL